MQVDKKTIILIITILLAFSIAIYFFLLRDFQDVVVEKKDNGGNGVEFLKDFDIDFEKLYTAWDLNFSEYDEVWLLGKYEGVDIEVGVGDQFILTDSYGNNFSNVDIKIVEGSATLPMDSYVLVEGTYDSSEPNVLSAYAVNIVEESTYEELMVARYPVVEIEILEDELKVDHGCQNLSVQVNIKNVGRVPVDYQKTYINYTGGAPYVFKSILDGEVFSIYPDSEFDGDSGPVGYKDGFRDFGILEPGQEEEVRYGLSGKVASTSGGISGTTNIFCRNDGDLEKTFRIDFANVHPSERGLTTNLKSTFIHTSSSNTIDVKIGTCECLLDTDSGPEPLE